MTSTGASCFTCSARLRSSSNPGKGIGCPWPRLPAGEGIGQENAGPLCPFIRQRRVQCLHGEADLEMSHDEGSWHNLEAEHPLRGGLLHLAPR